MKEIGIAQRYVVVKRDDGNWNDLIPKLDIPTEIISFMGEPDYKTMPYKDLIKLARDRGVFKVGMKRDDIIKELK
jgi:hypothetical protein